jgi:hypothetical protein
MKVINIVVGGLIILLVAQSFLTACPTCLYQLNQLDHESVGEMESSQTSYSYQDYSDLDDFDDTDGFEEYDKQILGELDNEKIDL